MKVLVCGGRNYDDKATLYSKLDNLETRPTVIIHGAARGADSLAGQWAKDRGIPVDVFPADWDTHGRSAGYIRNKQMLVEGKPDLVIAFEGGKGTENMVTLAERAKVPVIRIEV